MSGYLGWFYPWLYYLFAFCATAMWWLRPLLISVSRYLWGAAQGETEYARVSPVYTPAIWFIYFVCVLTLVVSLMFVIKEGGLKHWIFLILSGSLTLIGTIFLVLFGGRTPGGMLG